MLSLHAEPESLVFVQAGRLPRALGQVEPEIPPKAPSITSLTRRPVRAALIRTARKTRSSTVMVVLTLSTTGSKHRESQMLLRPAEKCVNLRGDTCGSCGQLL
jgi:hypothetical protein